MKGYCELKRLAIVGIYLCSVWLPQPVCAQDAPNLPHIQMVLFTPSDIVPPPDHQQRLTELADYTEKFFSHWMSHWNYVPERKSIFDRDENQKVVIRYARGNSPATTELYTKPAMFNEAYQSVMTQYPIERNGHVWWVHVYLGKDREYKDYRGSGDSASGGSSIARFCILPGKIDLKQHMLEGFHETYHLKGVVHEFGHALGLPHLGPKDADRLGNPLMGPNQYEWKRYRRPEPRTYLSEASAAMLWKHPILSGSTVERQRLPTVTVEEWNCRFNRAQRKLVIAGTLKSDLSAHSVVVVDASKAAASDYWRKSYVARIDEHGKFEVDVTEPAGADGELQIVFCFVNGAVTGDGKKRGLEGALTLPYRYHDRQLEVLNQ